MKQIALLLTCLGLLCTGPLLAASDEPRPLAVPERNYLVRHFSDKGFNAAYLREIFFDPRLKKRPLSLKKNLYHQENPRDYSDFTNAYSIHLANKFQKRWRTQLSRASQKYKVDKEVLVAILLVETGLGNVMGHYPVISVFSSILVAHENNKDRYPQLDYLDAPEAYGLKRLQKKAQWAETELAALLTIALQEKHSPYRYQGSYAGAFGLPQFLPSSYLKWGADGEGNGRVNLYGVPDAIHSTARYLEAHGWKYGLRKKQHLPAQREAIYGYNHSTPYVDTVLQVARILRQKSAQAQIQQSKAIARIKSENY